MKKKFSAIAISLLLPLIASCSGGGSSSSESTTAENGSTGGSSGGSSSGGSSSGGSTDSEFPTASILFPQQDGLWSDKEVFLVRGVSNDNEGVAKIVVNGVEAESSDGFATWTAQVPLQAGQATAIVVEATDINGNITPEAASATINSYNRFNSYRFCSPIAYDSGRNTAYTFNPPLALDLDTGAETPLAADLTDISGATFDPASGRFLLVQNDNLLSFNSDFQNPVTVSPSASPSFGSHPQIAINESTGTIYVMDWWGSYVVAVDPATGERSAFGSWKDADGNSVNLATPGFQVAGGRLFVSTETALYEVNLADSTATELSGPTVGSGPELTYAAGLAVDLTDGKAYIGDFYNQLLEIDLSTGDRKIVSPWTSGASENEIFEWLLHGFADAGSTVLVNSCLSGHSFAIDKQTGQRQRITRLTRGAGPVFTNIEDLHFDEYSGQLIASNEIYRDGRDTHHFNNAYAHQLLSVSLDTGNRQILSAPFEDPEPLMGRIKAIATNPRDGTIFAALYNQTGSSIVAFSRSTQKWHIVSENTVGGGPEISSFSGIAFDDNRNLLLATAFVRDQGMCLTRIDPASGDRAALACSGDYGTDQYWATPADIAVDSATDRAYVVDGEGAIVAVDLETGTKRILSGRGVGAGPELKELGQLALDIVGSQLLVENFMGKDPDTQKSKIQLIAVDLKSGDRSIAMQFSQRENEYVSITPTVNHEAGEIYLGLSNRSVAIFDRVTQQHLMLSQ